MQFSFLVFFFTLFSSAGLAQDLQFRLTAEPATLDWTLARSSHETYLIMNIMEGLVEVGSDLKVSPALAEKWDLSPDGKTYTFYIRNGVKWSDGKPLKASHFRDSWIRLLNPKTHSSYASFLFDIENAEEYHLGKIKDSSKVAVFAKSDLVFEVKLKKPVSYFIDLPSFWVTFPVRLDLIQKYGKQWTDPSKIVTLGPYLLTEWKKNRAIILKKNPHYYRASLLNPKSPNKVTGWIEPDDLKSRKFFEQGKTDFLLEVTTQDLFKKDLKAKTLQFPYLATFYLGFNVGWGPLKDPDLRKAIALAIDREGIPATLQGGQTLAQGWIPPGLEGHQREATLSGTIFDAKAALIKAGYPEGQGFPALPLYVEKFDGAALLAELISKNLKQKLGIMTVEKITSPKDFQRALRNGRAALFVTHWGADFPDPLNFLELFTSQNSANLTFWKNKEYDQYVTSARKILDQLARVSLYQAAEKLLLQKEVAILPLFYRKNTVVIGPRVESLEISPLNYLFFKNVTMK